MPSKHPSKTVNAPLAWCEISLVNLTCTPIQSGDAISAVGAVAGLDLHPPYVIYPRF